MIKIKYLAKNDPNKTSAPYWQVGFLDPNNQFAFTPVIYIHYSKYESHELARVLNSAIERHASINGIPDGDSNSLLGTNVIDPNDATESQKALDMLSSWLSATERLHESMKGSLIEKINEIKEITLNLLKAANNIDLQKDTQGNWRVYKK